MTKGESESFSMRQDVDQVIYWDGVLMERDARFHLYFSTVSGQVGICRFVPGDDTLTVYTAPTRKMLVVYVKLLEERRPDDYSLYPTIVAIDVENWF